MPRFSIKDLMIATMIVAVALGISLTILRLARRGDAYAEHVSMFWLYMLGWSLAGTGVMYPFKRIIPIAIGFLIGAVLGFIFLLVNPVMR